MGEEILKKRFIFEIKLCGNELCVVSFLPVTRERTFADFLLEEQVRSAVRLSVCMCS